MIALERHDYERRGEPCRQVYSRFGVRLYAATPLCRRRLSAATVSCCRCFCAIAAYATAASSPLCHRGSYSAAASAWVESTASSAMSSAIGSRSMASMASLALCLVLSLA